MTKALREMFRSLAPFSDEELEEAKPLFHLVCIPRQGFFSKAGRIADRIAFVNQGILRSFFTVGDRETTTFFLFPGSIATALQSFVHMNPARENIQAIEETELTVIRREDLYKLYENSWKWQQVGRRLIEEYYLQLEDRLITLQSQTASERYELFAERHPEVIRSVPLQHIASYLGISPETLSRIRNK
jgi:CRP-like cAMP-binding protein